MPCLSCSYTIAKSLLQGFWYSCIALQAPRLVNSSLLLACHHKKFLSVGGEHYKSCRSWMLGCHHNVFFLHNSCLSLYTRTASLAVFYCPHWWPSWNCKGFAFLAEKNTRLLVASSTRQGKARIPPHILIVSYCETTTQKHLTYVCCCNEVWQTLKVEWCLLVLENSNGRMNSLLWLMILTNEWPDCDHY